jgi:hypothetical protein
MSLLERLLARRKSNKEDEAAIAREQQEELRAGDEPEKSQADIVGEAFDKFPPS